MSRTQDLMIQVFSAWHVTKNHQRKDGESLCISVLVTGSSWLLCSVIALLVKSNKNKLSPQVVFQTHHRSCLTIKQASSSVLLANLTFWRYVQLLFHWRTAGSTACIINCTKYFHVILEDCTFPQFDWLFKLRWNNLKKSESLNNSKKKKAGVHLSAVVIGSEVLSLETCELADISYWRPVILCFLLKDFQT